MKECAYEEDCYADLPPCGDRLHRRRMFFCIEWAEKSKRRRLTLFQKVFGGR